MLSPFFSLAYLKLIILGGTITFGLDEVIVPIGNRYISFHEENPVDNPTELVGRQQVLFDIDEELIIAVNSNRLDFPDFETSGTLFYCSIWSALSEGQLIAYTRVEIPIEAVLASSLRIEPQMLVFEPSMCG